MSDLKNTALPTKKTVLNSEESTTFNVNVIAVKEITVSSEITLLASLELAKIDLHYHCRQGFCGACRTKLMAGEVLYTTDPLAYIDDDEILPCCCIPVTDITIKTEQ